MKRPPHPIKIPAYLEKYWRKLSAEERQQARVAYKEEMREHYAALERGDSGYTFNGIYHPFFEAKMRLITANPSEPKRPRKKTAPKRYEHQGMIFAEEESGIKGK